MLDIIPSNHRHFFDFDCLRTHWLFSFANGFDRKTFYLAPCLFQ